MTTPRTPRPATFAQSPPGVVAVAVLAVLSGCAGSVTDLDREVADLVARRQQAALGGEGVRDASVAAAPQSPLGVKDIYDERPATHNPAARDLPARPAASIAIDAETFAADTEEAASGSDPLLFDLPALLAYAIENAPEYRSEKEELFLQTLALIIERHAWGPRFFNTLSSDISGTPESGDYDTALDLVNDFNITQRLPYGGDISVSALVNYTTLLQQASTSSSPDETQNASINASIDLPLLRGSGQVAREDLIQAERDLIYAARDFERFRREFFVDISNTYFNLLQQKQRIINQQQQIEGLERLAAEQRQKNEAGRIPGFEADDAEAQVLFGQSNLASVLDNYASALDSLKLRIGMQVAQPLEIVKVDLEVPRPASDAAESILIGQAARLDLQNTADEVDDARRAVLIARDRMRGDLGVNASINLRTDSDSDVDGLDFELGDSDYRVGLDYAAPLDRKIELAQYRRSLVDLERTERDYRTQRDRVALDIRDASREIERAALTYDLQGRNVTLAERRLENIKILRRRGTVEARRLIEAEEDLLDARNSRDEALADLQTSVLNYLLQTGQMRVGPRGNWLAPGTLVPVDAPQPEPVDPGVGPGVDPADGADAGAP